jgi:hypothetical protein
MRWILAALVLANIGLLMWGSWYKDASLSEPAIALVPIAEDQMLHVREVGAQPLLRKESDRPTPQLQAIQHVCYGVGPFSSTATAAKGGTELKKLGLQYRLRTKEEESKVYRVYLPPSASRADALAMQGRLVKIGFKETIILRERAMNNAVSIGVYSVEKNAKDVLEKLKKKGIRARLQTIDRVMTRHWLDIDSAEVAVETLQGIRWGKGVAVEQVPCQQTDSKR